MLLHLWLYFFLSLEMQQDKTQVSFYNFFLMGMYCVKFCILELCKWLLTNPYSSSDFVQFCVQRALCKPTLHAFICTWQEKNWKLLMKPKYYSCLNIVPGSHPMKRLTGNYLLWTVKQLFHHTLKFVTRLCPGLKSSDIAPYCVGLFHTFYIKIEANVLLESVQLGIGVWRLCPYEKLP